MTLLGGWVIVLDPIVFVDVSISLVLVKTERPLLMAFDASYWHS
jgi:hypothetical protein